MMSNLLNVDNSKKEYFNSVVGKTVTVNDALEGDVRDLTVFIEPIQSGSGTPSSSNHRTISGVISVTVTRTGGSDSQSVTISTGAAGTVYGGKINVTKGELVITWGIYSSYNGQTLPGRWISDRDVYSNESVPSNGAQVIYELSSYQTYQIEPMKMTTVNGQNIFTSSNGEVAVKYKLDPTKVTISE